MATGLVPHPSGVHVDIQLWQDSFKKIFDQLKPRRDYCQGETVKYAAMVVSQQTRDFRQENDTIWHVAEGVANSKGQEILRICAFWGHFGLPTRRTQSIPNRYKMTRCPGNIGAFEGS